MSSIVYNSSSDDEGEIPEEEGEIIVIPTSESAGAEAFVNNSSGIGSITTTTTTTIANTTATSTLNQTIMNNNRNITSPKSDLGTLTNTTTIASETLNHNNNNHLTTTSSSMMMMYPSSKTDENKTASSSSSTTTTNNNTTTTTTPTTTASNTGTFHRMNYTSSTTGSSSSNSNSNSGMDYVNPNSNSNNNNNSYSSLVVPISTTTTTTNSTTSTGSTTTTLPSTMTTTTTTAATTHHNNTMNDSVVGNNSSSSSSSSHYAAFTNRGGGYAMNSSTPLLVLSTASSSPLPPPSSSSSVSNTRVGYSNIHMHELRGMGTSSSNSTGGSQQQPPPPPPLRDTSLPPHPRNHSISSIPPMVRGGPPPQQQQQSYPLSTTLPRGNGSGLGIGSSLITSAVDGGSGGVGVGVGGWPPRGGGGAGNAGSSSNNNNSNNNIPPPARSTYDIPPPSGGGWQSRGPSSGGTGGGAGGGRGIYRGGMGGGGGRGGGNNIQRHSSFGGPPVSSTASTSSSSLLGSLPPKNSMNVRSQSYGPSSTSPLPNSHRGSGPPPSSSLSSSQQQQRPTDPRFRGSHSAASAGVYSIHDSQMSSLIGSTVNSSDTYISAARPNDGISHNTYRSIGSSQQRHTTLPPMSSSLEGSSSSLNNNNSFSALADPDISMRRASVNSMGASSGGLDGSDHSGSTVGTYSSIALQRGGVGVRRGSSEVLEVPIITSSDSIYHRSSIRENGPFRSNSFRGGNMSDTGPYNRSTSLAGGPSNMRGGLSGPSLSTDSAESTFRGNDYYGPKGFSNSTDYTPLRQSPSQRGGGGGGRPGFRVGVSGLSTQPLHRDSPLPPPASVQQQQQQHRRNDPRFAAMAAKSDSLFTSDTQQHNSVDHQRIQPNEIPSHDDISRASSIGGFERGRYSHDGPAPFRRNSTMATQHQPMNRLVSDTNDDTFGRTNQWKTSSRPSPTSTPEDRKPSQNYFPSSPGSIAMQPPPPPNLSSTTSRDISTDKANVHGGALNQSIASTSSIVSAVVAKNTDDQVSTPTDKKPASLLTSALGDENTDRAEKAVAEVELALQLTNANTGYLRELPSKLQIVQSLKVLDAQIKKFQNDIKSNKRDIEEATAAEEELRLKAIADAITEAQRELERNLEKEKERKLAEEEAHGAEIQLYIKEQTEMYEAQQSKHLSELEAKLKTVKEEEEKKMREALNEQMITTADNFDRDIVQMKKELEKVTMLSKKTETRLATVEKDYHEKVVQSGKEETEDIQTKPVDVVSQILAENRRRAAEAHLMQPTFVSQDEESESDHSHDDLSLVTDPLHGKTTAEWAQLARQAKGPADALYSEPSKAPYYAHNERMFELIAPIVQEHVRHKQNKLKKRWIELAEEYEYRQNEYKKELSKTENADKPKKAHAVPVRHSILQGSKPNQPIVDSVSGRTSSNPYRRARRGNEVRSEYEQEQIIAEIAAKEAMEKRITFGGTDLPRQICQVERELTCSYINTFKSQRVDLIEQERELALCNVWTDMEKSIFLDRWLQFPKDFKKIASFLRNKTTKDCIQFYYDSKQSVPYKGALREHVMRRKRRGDYNIWTLTIEAALSVGAIVQAGTSEEKPVVFLLPESDDTYSTRLFHPMKREVYDAMIIKEQTVAGGEDDFDEDSKAEVSKKRLREPLFTLDREQSKFLKEATPPPIVKSPAPTHSNMEASDGNLTDDGTKDGSQTPMRKAPQKWTNNEKRMFLETLEKHGKNWAMLAEAVGTKTISQIKNYHYDYKKKAGKGRAEQTDKSTSREEETATPPPEPSEPVEHTPVPEAQAPYHETTPTEAIHPRVSASNYHAIQAQHLQQYQTHPVQHHGQQHPLPQYHPLGNTGGMQQSVTHLLHSADNDRSIPHSEASTPDRLDLWAHAHRLQTEEAARHLLLQQHSQQTQQQQILSNLLPWINSGQLSHVAASNLQDQQLQNFLQLQQQQQQPQNHFNHLAALGLTGLTGIGGLGQQTQQHHHQAHHQHQQQQHHHPQHHVGSGQQSHQRQNSHDAQLVLAQHLLSMQAQQQQGTGSTGTAVDALGLLARALPDPSRNGSNNSNQGGGNYHG